MNAGSLKPQRHPVGHGAQTWRRNISYKGYIQTAAEAVLGLQGRRLRAGKARASPHSCHPEKVPVPTDVFSPFVARASIWAPLQVLPSPPQEPPRLPIQKPLSRQTGYRLLPVSPPGAQSEKSDGQRHPRTHLAPTAVHDVFRSFIGLRLHVDVLFFLVIYLHSQDPKGRSTKIQCDEIPLFCPGRKQVSHQTPRSAESPIPPAPKRLAKKQSHANAWSSQSG